MKAIDFFIILFYYLSEPSESEVRFTEQVHDNSDITDGFIDTDSASLNNQTGTEISINPENIRINSTVSESKSELILNWAEAMKLNSRTGGN